QVRAGHQSQDRQGAWSDRPAFDPCPRRRGDRMRRRSVIVGLAALLLAPERASAQQAPLKTPRVGILTVADSDRTPIFDALLRELGYVEGLNIILEFRLAHGDFTRLPTLAAELVKMPVDIIVADNGLDALVNATSTIPIVAIMGDP